MISLCRNLGSLGETPGGPTAGTDCAPLCPYSHAEHSWQEASATLLLWLRQSSRFFHLIISKLDWARESRSEQQFGDIRNLVSTGCDLAYIRHWTNSLELHSLWKEFER